MDFEKMKPRYLGVTILIISAIVLISLFLLNQSIKQNNLIVCEEICSLQKDVSCSIDACLFSRDGHQTSFYLIGLFVAFMGGIGFYLLLSKEEKIIERKSYDLTRLSKEEKQIFKFIRENKEKGTYQSNLVENFNFPKSKVTRILDKLESEKLVERKRRGMSNLIVLK